MNLKPSTVQATPKWAKALQNDETIVRSAGIHPGIYWKGVAVFVLSVFLLITPAFNLGVFLMFVSLLTLSFAYLTKYYLLLVLTTKNIMVRHGIVQLDVVQMNLGRIESVEISKTVMGRLLGYSTVLLTGIGNRVTGVPFIIDADAHAFRADLQELLAKRDDAGKS